jgi:hypothetical protein
VVAETIKDHFKAEVIRRRGPWRNFEAVEFATWNGSSGLTAIADFWSPLETYRQPRPRNRTAFQFAGIRAALWSSSKPCDHLPHPVTQRTSLRSFDAPREVRTRYLPAGC